MNYKALIDSFSDLQVMIIGDVMIDSYIWGKVERISPEAPVPIVAVSQREDRLGGAANVALNIAAMGATPILCSIVGADTARDSFLNLMQAQKMCTNGIVASAGRTTTVKKRIIGNKMQMLRIDEEVTHPINTQEEQMFLATITKILDHQKIDVIIFQDYDKGVLTPVLIKTIVNMAKARRILTTVDPKKRNFAEYKQVTLFKPNLKELKEGLKIDFDSVTIDNLNDAANLLQAKQRMEMVFITLSEHGVYLCDWRDGSVKTYQHPAFLRNIADVSGAGDTVISVASLCLAAGLPAEQLMRLSNLAGGIVCESVGVMPIDKQRFLDELNLLES